MIWLTAMAGVVMAWAREEWVVWGDGTREREYVPLQLCNDEIQMSIFIKIVLLLFIKGHICEWLSSHHVGTWPTPQSGGWASAFTCWALIFFQVFLKQGRVWTVPNYLKLCSWVLHLEKSHRSVHPKCNREASPWESHLDHARLNI